MTHVWLWLGTVPISWLGFKDFLNSWFPFWLVWWAFRSAGDSLMLSFLAAGRKCLWDLALLLISGGNGGTGGGLVKGDLEDTWEETAFSEREMETGNE